MEYETAAASVDDDDDDDGEYRDRWVDGRIVGPNDEVREWVSE